LKKFLFPGVVFSIPAISGLFPLTVARREAPITPAHLLYYYRGDPASLMILAWAGTQDREFPGLKNQKISGI
jgi:hypothetical protein